MSTPSLRNYVAEVIRPSVVIGEKVKIQTRNFRKQSPRRYENCDKPFYVIHTYDNTKVEVVEEADEHCIYNKNNKKPYYIRVEKDASISGKKFIIESTDRNISILDKYTIVKLSATHKAQVQTSKSYTRCTLDRERDEIISSEMYQQLVDFKQEQLQASGILNLETK